MLNVFTTAYMNSRYVGNEFQKFVKELCLTATRLCTGSTAGARRRRQAMLIILSTAHKGIKTLAERADDKGYFEELEKAKEEETKEETTKE